MCAATYAEREAPGLWVALCLDFDLAAQGETFDEARHKLDAMIDDYVREAWEGEDQPYAEALLNRRAPLRYWLRFWWFSLWSRIRQREGIHRSFNGRLPIERPLSTTDVRGGQTHPARARIRATQGR